MNTRQIMSHRTRAVGPLVARGELLLTLFNVFIMHKNKVSNRPRRPGMASLGTKKLICKIFYVMRTFMKLKSSEPSNKKLSPMKQGPTVQLGKLFQ